MPYINGKKVIGVCISSVPTQEKTAYASASEQVNVLPDNGKTLSKVIIPMVVASTGMGQRGIQQSDIKQGVSVLGVYGSLEEGKPIEIATASGMNAALIAANIGKVYRYIGPTDATYTNGDLYEVTEE